jgi:serine/threonine protein kinase
MANLEGHKLGHYRLLRQIGHGGMGEIYLAEDTSDNPLSQVAIKVVRIADTTLSGDAEALRLFREGRFLTELQHPHIVPIYHDGIRDDFLFLVMPYMPDGSLADAIHGRSRVQLNLPLTTERVVDFVNQIGDALQYTHDRHIIHRDVKPGNVLIDVEPNGHWHLLLADFGIARNVETTTREAQWRGTVAYMAPEQFRGEISPAADQYALAVLAFELLTGQVPWAMQPPAVRTLNPAVSPAVEAVLRQALAVRPEERFGSVAAFADALQRAAAGDDLTMPTDSDTEDASATKPMQWLQSREPYPTPSGRRRWLTLVAAGLIVAMIATSTAFILNARHLAAGSGQRTTHAGAVVIQGTVYVGGYVGSNGTSGPASMYAFRANDGKLRWRRSLPCPLVAPVAVGPGTVYAYTAPCNQSPGALFALQSSDGTLMWQYTLAAPWRSTIATTPYGLDSSGDGPVPVVVNGVVYLISANYSDSAESPNLFGSIFAVDALHATDGTRIWHVQIAGDGYAPAPVAVGSTLCLAIPDGSLNTMHTYALRLDDGHTIWQDSVPSNAPLVPASQAGDTAILYTAYGQQIGLPASELTAQRATDGRALWRSTLPEYGVLVVKNGTVFDLGSSANSNFPTSLYAVQASTGTVLWHTDQYGSATAITVDNGQTYLGSNNGVVWALSAGDGHEVWQGRVSGAAVDDLAATNGAVYVSSLGGYLDAFNAAGTRIWSARIDQQHPSPPVIGP